MKKFLSIMLLAVLALVLVACGGPSDQEVLDEQVNAMAITYADGENATSVKSNVTLATISVEGFSVTWASNNENAINAEGKVTRPEAGQDDATVELTATVAYKELSATKKFTLVVKAKDAIKPLSVEITGNDKMVMGATYTLNAVVAPENTTDKTLTWESSDPTIATVDAEGKVTAIALGNVTITAKCNANTAVSEAFIITVVEPTADTIAATQAKAAGENGWVKGVVMGTYARGYLVYDGTGFILVYMNKTAFTQKVGDYVEIKGVLGEYNNAKQFTDAATVTAIEETAPEYKISAQKLKDGAAGTAFMGAFEYGKKLSFRMTVTKTTESYINGVIKGSEVGVAVAYPADSTAYTVGKDYDVVGYALYTKENDSVNSLYVMVEKAEEVDYGFDVKITYKDGETTTDETVNSLLFPIVELPTPEEVEGLVFLGWFTGTEAAPVKCYGIYTPEDITLFARWATVENAPLFVDPACEDGSSYTTISEAVAAAKEGQEIYLAPGEYVEEYVTPVERTYNTAAALMEAYCADYRATVGRSSGTVDLFETSTAESSWMTTMLSNAEMTAKWSWLYKALGEVAENDDMDPEIFTPADVRFNYMVNLYGLFSGTKHADSGMKSYVSANFANPALVKKVLIAGPKVDDSQSDTVENKIVIDKKVTFVGPNANVLGQDSDNRNDEAEIKSAIVITANGVKFDGCAFLAEGTIGLGANDITIVNCYIATEKYAHGDTENRQAQIYNMKGVRPVNISILNTYFSFAGNNYTAEAITAGYYGIENVTIDNCVFEGGATTPAIYECIFFYNVYGDLIVTNNTFNFATSEKGYTIRLGEYGAYVRYFLFKDNTFAGMGDNGTSKIGIIKTRAYNGKAGVIEFIHNKFENVKPDTIMVNGASTYTPEGVLVNVLYNYFDEKQEFSMTNTAAATVNFNNNCVLGAKNAASAIDPAAQATKYDTLEALEAAYATYKATAEATNTLTFNVDGGTAIDAVNFANPYLVKLPTPVKENFEFAGWYDGETKVTGLTAKADVTLTAKWVKINTITFDVDGGSAVETIKFTDFSKVTTLPASEKTGITFGGWYEGDTKVTAITENRDYNLKAKWEGDYTLTYDTDGGETLTPVSFSDYTAVTLATPTKEGFEFLGWYVGETKYEALTENNSITLTAKWGKLYTITYDYNGGSITTIELDVLSYGFAKSYWASANHPTTVWLLSKAAGHFTDDYSYGYKIGLNYDATNKVFTVAQVYVANGTAKLADATEDYIIMANGSYKDITAYKTIAVGDKLTLSVDVATLTETAEVDLKMSKSETGKVVTTSKLPNSELLTGPTKGEQILEGWYNGEVKVTEITVAENITLVAHYMDKPTGLIYKTAAEVGAAYVEDFKTYAGKNLADATCIDTSKIDSSSMVNMLKDATLNAKWAWLYDALAGENTDMKYTNIATAESAVKGFYLANLCGFFTSTAHTDTHLKTLSADYSVAATSEAVLNAGPTHEN